MSHVVRSKVTITSLECLERAAKKCGVELRRGQKTYNWWGRHVGDYPMPAGFKAQDLGKCEHAIGVPGNSQAYEMGVCRARAEDGTEIEGYTLLFDFYGTHGKALESRVGKNGSALLKRYQEEVVRRQLRGHHIQRTETPNGGVRLRVRVG